MECWNLNYDAALDMFYDPGLSSGGFKKRTFAEKKHISGRWFQPTPLKIVVIIPTIVVIYGYMMGLQHIIYIYMSGWWYTYPSEKYESQLGL